MPTRAKVSRHIIHYFSYIKWGYHFNPHLQRSSRPLDLSSQGSASARLSRPCELCTVTSRWTLILLQPPLNWLSEPPGSATDDPSTFSTSGRYVMLQHATIPVKTSVAERTPGQTVSPV